MAGGAAAVLARARAGDIPGAIDDGEALLAQGLRDPGLAMFVGMMCGRTGDLPRGIPHLRRAVELAAGDMAPKVELARALMASNAIAEVIALVAPLAAPASPTGREMQRIHGHALFRDGQAGAAAQQFEVLTGVDPADFESWGGLGAARLVDGDLTGAIAALERAVALRPEAVASWVNLARALSATKDYPAAVDAARAAVGHDPVDPAAQLELGRALAGTGEHEAALTALALAAPAEIANAELFVDIADLQFTCKAPERAEASYRAALALRPGFPAAMLGLGKTLERLNRTDELVELLASMPAAGLGQQDTALLRAFAMRNSGRYAEALAIAETAPAEGDFVAREQLIGDLADRLGDPDRAFAAFTAANDRLATDNQASQAAAKAYLDGFGRIRDLLTPAWYAGWSRPGPTPGRAAPMFVFGFPRSGTTLLDTMLGGHPGTVVLEEAPVIHRVAEALGPIERLATASAREIDALRDLYWAEVAKVAPEAGDRLVIDKHPLALGNTPLLHRLFPDARFVFVERHPCDVVLSCFIMSSRMSAEVASFYSFTGTARLYDRVLAFWARATEVLPITVHRLRYERLIADPEAQLRAVAAFAGLAWNPRMMANEQNAVERRYIGSPSYAQVAEPLYTRARGRWLRYREHMAPVLPILAPWAARLGYDIG